ncbi:MAG: deoxyguanosinetriphosphate triphosphohydrolase family protein [Methylobacter sp.]
MQEQGDRANRDDLWQKRLNSDRRKSKGTETNQSDTDSTKFRIEEKRTEIERDFDRILFSTPLRRLADKTQVFPLDRNDSVRNRLTHSYEVSNLARSFGVMLSSSNSPSFNQIKNAQRDVPALLAAIGLVHDLGNPPFGHQGEAAIQHWFKENKIRILKNPGDEDEDLFKDFLLFEGNAQTFRLVTRLQLLDNIYGLDLTYATLAAMMKYPTTSADIDRNIAAKKKHGYFQSEKEIAEDVLQKVGLTQGFRHPFAYIMEACDDIAYVVFDAEDSVKKGLASFSDLVAYLNNNCKGNDLANHVVKQSENKHNQYRETDLSPAELNDISMQRFRVYAIGAMIYEASRTFLEKEKGFVEGSEKSPLLKLGKAETLRKAMKEFSLTHGYTHKSVLALELEGFNTIRGLMDMLWFSIDEMTEETKVSQKEPHPFAKYVYTRISENYRRCFDSSKRDGKLPLWYYKCQLLTDMVSGMTDSYALSLYDEFKPLQGDCKLKS